MANREKTAPNNKTKSESSTTKGTEKKQQSFHQKKGGTTVTKTFTATKPVHAGKTTRTINAASIGRKIITDKPLKNEEEYNSTMDRIEDLMNLGSESVTFEQLQEIRSLSLKAQAYESAKYIIDAPETLAGILELKMYELKLKQKQLAAVLEISDAKLSLVISGKQKPDVELLKKVHSELNVDAHLLLTLP